MIKDRLKAKAPDEIMAVLNKMAKPQKQLCQLIRKATRRVLIRALELLLFNEISGKDANLWRDCVSYKGVLTPEAGEQQSITPERFRYCVRRIMPGDNVHGWPEELVVSGLPCGTRAANGTECVVVCCAKSANHQECACGSVRGAAKHGGACNKRRRISAEMWESQRQRLSSKLWVRLWWARKRNALISKSRDSVAPRF
jgi:hypothetical protein